MLKKFMQYIVVFVFIYCLYFISCGSLPIGGNVLITQTEKINVLNYNENKVSVMVSPTESFTFEPSTDGEIPSVIPMTFEQVRYANNYNTFRGGFLFFEKEKAKEIYEELGVNGWENILNNKDIENILLNPSYEGLNKILNIKDSAVFERVRAVFYKLKSKGTDDISVRVQQIISTRYKELQNKKVTTSIIIEKKDITSPVPNKEVETLKAENKAMQEQLAAMQAMMEKLLAQQTAAKDSAANDTKKEETTSKKSSGRAKKNTE